jgi:hypothetical protein
MLLDAEVPHSETIKVGFVKGLKLQVLAPLALRWQQV